MFRLSLLIITFLLLSNLSFANKDSLDFKTVDYKTYGFYLNQNWDSLIYLGNLAIDNDIDYYYLRIRLGMAYYVKEKYQKASFHFEQALLFNSQSEFAMEYLYYSYIESGRETEARLLSKSFNDLLRSKIKISENKFLSQVYAEGGYILSNNETKNKSIDIDGQANIYGETNLAKDKYYFHLGLQHDIGKRLSIYQAYNNLTIDNTRIVKFLDMVRITDNYLIYQHEYYINADWFMKKGFNLTPAFHYVYLNYKIGTDYKDTSISKIVASLALSKHFLNTNVSLFGTYSNFEESKHVQAGLLLTLYPFSNLKFYSTSGFINLNTITTTPPPTTRGNKDKKGLNLNITSDFIFSELIGVKYYKNNWLEISATYGNLKNANEKNALIVYNTTDKINYKFEANLFSQLNKKIRLSLGYQYWDFTGSYLIQNSYSPDDFQIINTNYQNHLITGGIKWNL